METATTFFGRAGEFLQNVARWIILFVRRYPLAAVAYLVIYTWCLFNYANQSVPPPPPFPPSAQSPAPAPAPVASAPAPVAPAPVPTVVVAQAKAYQNGNTITIRWNQPVSSQQLIADGSFLAANCQPQSCTATLTQRAYFVRASWHQGSEYFDTKFKL